MAGNMKEHWNVAPTGRKQTDDFLNMLTIQQQSTVHAHVGIILAQRSSLISRALELNDITDAKFITSSGPFMSKRGWHRLLACSELNPVSIWSQSSHINTSHWQECWGKNQLLFTFRMSSPLQDYSALKPSWIWPSAHDQLLFGKWNNHFNWCMIHERLKNSSISWIQANQGNGDSGMRQV